MRALSTVLLLAGLLIPGVARGEEEVSVVLGDSVVLVPSGQYRPRFLAHGGQDFKAGNVDDTFSHRARLGLEARLLERYSLKVVAQDVRTWGEETSTLADYAADGLDLHEAWAEARCPLGLALRIGRQELAYDNQRLIGAVNFAQQGRSFDAVRLRYSGAGGAIQAEGFYAKTGEEDAFRESTDAGGKPVTLAGSPRDTDLAGLWLRYAGLRHLRPSLALYYDWFGPNSRNRYTVGTYIDGEPLRDLTYSAELYYQGGHQGSDELGQDISAFMGALRAGYRAPVRLRPSITGWVEYLSGDDDPADDKVRVFDTLYATNHGLYGYMDLFTNIPVHTKGYGLLDLGFRVKVEPAPWLQAWIDYHHFRLAKRHPTNAVTLGNEVDLLVSVPLGRHLDLQGVFAAFMPRPGASLMRAELGDEDTELYGYIQTDLRF